MYPGPTILGPLPVGWHWTLKTKKPKTPVFLVKKILLTGETPALIGEYHISPLFSRLPLCSVIECMPRTLCVWKYSLWCWLFSISGRLATYQWELHRRDWVQEQEARESYDKLINNIDLNLNWIRLNWIIFNYHILGERNRGRSVRSRGREQRRRSKLAPAPSLNQTTFSLKRKLIQAQMCFSKRPPHGYGAF